MMIKTVVMSALLMGSMVSYVSANTQLQGYVYSNKPIVNSQIIIHDAAQQTLSTTTNDEGFYHVDVSGLIPPLLVFSDNNSVQPIVDYAKQVCSGLCVASFSNTLQRNQINTVNLTPFSDLVMSEIAAQLGDIGPAQFIEKGLSKPVPDAIVAKAYHKFHALFDVALGQVGMTPTAFDPIHSVNSDVNKLFDVMISNRGYDSNRGQLSRTVLLDMRFKPISEQSPFDYERALKQKNELLNAKKRIFILSDSTASNYDVNVYPRMGWGQVFDRFIDDPANVVVINGAQSGRSSRSFYNEGWFDLMVPFMQKGDVMMVAFGHNDEKCDNSNPKRGHADVSHLCTYPNDAQQHKQYPEGQPDRSFQTSLERYIHFAKQKQMTPILMTPVSRFRDANNKIAYQNPPNSPVTRTHYTTKKDGIAYAGNYSDTVKQTAKANHISLIDLDGLSIDFANQHKDDWRLYWLAVDPNDARYPYYKNQSSGVMDHPDITHFQEKGALEIAKIVSNAIKHDPKLNEIGIMINSAAAD